MSECHNVLVHFFVKRTLCVCHQVEEHEAKLNLCQKEPRRAGPLNLATSTFGGLSYRSFVLDNKLRNSMDVHALNDSHRSTSRAVTSSNRALCRPAGALKPCLALEHLHHLSMVPLSHLSLVPARCRIDLSPPSNSKRGFVEPCLRMCFR